MGNRKGFIPFEVPNDFWEQNKDLQYLEACIVYLRCHKEMKFRDIAIKLNRSHSGVAEQFSRVQKRRGGISPCTKK